MTLFRMSLGALALLAALPAHAAPIQDIPAWSRDFAKAALANDPDAMFETLRGVAHPGFNLDGLHAALEKLQSFTGNHPGDFTEEFGEGDVGTFLKRINVAVHYTNTYMYYTLTFRRDLQGWQMLQFNYNTNVNEALSVKWPE